VLPVEDAAPAPAIALGGQCNNFVATTVFSKSMELAMEPSREQKERFRALAAAQLARLHGLARRLVGDEAEDAVQDCLLKAFRGFARLEDHAAAQAWLTSILVNCCRDRARSRARRPVEIDVEEVARESAPLTQADTRILLRLRQSCHRSEAPGGVHSGCAGAVELAVVGFRIAGLVCSGPAALLSRGRDGGGFADERSRHGVAGVR